jgi:hypothetical protein
MTHEDFDQLIREIETGIGRNPGALRRPVLWLAALGYAGLFSPLAAVALLSLGFLVPGVLWMPDSLPLLVVGAFILSLGGWAVGNASNRDGSLDRGMRVVTEEFEVLELEVVDAAGSRVELHLRERAGLAG